MVVDSQLRPVVRIGDTEFGAVVDGAVGAMPPPAYANSDSLLDIQTRLSKKHGEGWGSTIRANAAPPSIMVSAASWWTRVGHAVKLRHTTSAVTDTVPSRVQ